MSASEAKRQSRRAASNCMPARNPCGPPPRNPWGLGNSAGRIAETSNDGVVALVCPRSASSANIRLAARITRANLARASLMDLQLSYVGGRSTGNSAGGACAILLLSCIEARNAAHRALSFVKTHRFRRPRDRLRVAASRFRQDDKVMYTFLPNGSNRRNRVSVSEIPGGLSNSRRDIRGVAQSFC